MAISGKIQNLFDIRDTQQVGVVAVPYSPRLEHTINFADGSGARRAERAVSRSITIGASPTDLDLAGTDLKDLNGNNIAFVAIKGLILHAPASNTADVVVGNDGTAPWASLLNAAGTLTLKPGTSLSVATESATGYTVTGGTADILQVAGTTGDVLNLAILGEV